jgi:NADPH:quinone reductase-like Zn-dependent oxidoreductase
MVHTKYGSPDVLVLEDVDQPEPADDEVLVEVHAASINEWDWGRLMARPFVNRLMFGVLRPRRKNTILGCDISGRVEAVGSEVEQFRRGDEVFGDLSGCGWGGFAEYVCAPEDILAPKSTGMTFEQAAAVPQAGLLALQGLRKGQIARGQRALLNGAGGGVGTFAIQIARSIGAEVTAVDSAEKLEVMRSLGADHVIDYAREDFTESGQTYELILDVMARRSLSDYRRSLSPDGTCILVGGSTSVIQKAMLFGSRGQKKIRLLLHKPNPDDLADMNELFEGGEVVPVVDAVYPLSELPGAFRYYAEGHHKGKVVISMADTT